MTMTLAISAAAVANALMIAAAVALTYGWHADGVRPMVLPIRRWRRSK